MDSTHLHLLINHLPIMGAFLSVPLLAIALWRRAERGPLFSAVTVLTLAAAGAGGAQLTGEATEEAVEDLPGVSEPWIHVHEERAETATILSVLTAVAGLGTLAWSVRSGRTPLLGTAGLTVCALVTSGAMAWTGAAGGQIRHSEIRGSAPPPGGEEAEARADRAPGAWRAMSERGEADEEERGEANERGEADEGAGPSGGGGDRTPGHADADAE